MILDGFLDTVRMLLVDPELTRRFVDEFRGSHVIFPKNPRAPSFARLVAAVGADAAERLRAHFAGENFYVPRDRAAMLAARDEEIRARINAGESIREVARTTMQLVPMTERQVRRALKGDRSDVGSGDPSRFKRAVRRQRKQMMGEAA